MIASQQQKRMFFALAHQLGYDAEIVKERAKKHFGLDSFKNATKDQLKWLIDKLENQLPPEDAEQEAIRGTVEADMQAQAEAEARYQEAQDYDAMMEAQSGPEGGEY